MNIPITRYTRPHGRTEATTRVGPDSAQKILDAGLTFWEETLPNGRLVLGIQNEDDDIWIEVCDAKDSDIDAALIRLIEKGTA